MERLTRALYTLAACETQAMLAGASAARFEKDRARSAEYRSKLVAIDRSQLYAELALDGRILDANANFLMATGYALADIVGKPHRLLCPPDHMEEAPYRAFRQQFMRGEFHAREFQRCAWGDRTSKLAFAKLRDKANVAGVVAFLDELVEVVPYDIHTVLTNNGIQFADLPKNCDGPTARWRGHPIDRACRRHKIEHRLTKPTHPWTNGQVEQMNRTIKDATVKRYHYDSHDQLRQHLGLFIDAYNHTRRLKTLRGLTPYEYVARVRTEDPGRFRID